LSKELVVSSTAHETRVATLEDDRVVEISIERASEHALAGNIYKGRVSRVLPGMQSAFVKIGLERDAFLYVSDVIDQTANIEDGSYDDEDDEAVGRGSRDSAKSGDDASAADDSDDNRRGGRGGRGRRRRGGRGRSDDSREADRSQNNRKADDGDGGKDGESTDSRDSRSDESEEREGGRSRGRRRRGRGGRGRGRQDDDRSRESQELRSKPRRQLDGDEDVPLKKEEEDDDFTVLPGESLRKYKDENEPVEEEESEEYEVEIVEGEEALAYADDDEIEWVYEEVEVEVDEDAEDEEESPDSPEDDSPDEASDESEEADDDDQSDEPESDEEVSDEVDSDEEASRDDDPSEDDPADDAPEDDSPEDDSLESDRDADDEGDSSSDSADEEEAADPDEESSDDSGSAPDSDEENSDDDSSDREDDEPEPSAAEEAEVRDRSDDRAPRRGRRGRGRGRGRRSQTDDADSSEAVERDADGHEVAPGRPVDADADDDGERDEKRRGGRRDGRRGGRGGRSRDDRGKRQNAPAAADDDSGQPRIADLLKPGQDVVVQIAKEPLGKKGARITSHIALPGRYLVYMPTVAHVGVSRKIHSDAERLRLRRLIRDNMDGAPGGFIVRTAGQTAGDEALVSDMQFLIGLWRGVEEKAERRQSPAILHQDLDVVERILRDQLGQSFKTIWVDSEEEYERVLRFMERFQPELVDRVKLYSRDKPIFDEFGVSKEIEKALRPKVWLKSGGYLVINQTEALIAVDVNTGKFVGKSNRLEDTIVKTNLEAAEEIVRQMRLRDLGGILILDFIDMDDRANRKLVMQALERALRTDRSPSKALSFNEFGLIAVTRKRVKQSLERTLSSACSACDGSGHVKSVSTMIFEILEEAQKVSAKRKTDKDVTIRVHPEIARVLKSRDNAYLQELEETFRSNVIVRGDLGIHRENYDINA